MSLTIWIFSILVRSNSNQDTSFVTFNPNLTFFLAPEAEHLLNSSSFLILTGSGGRIDPSFIPNTLLQGLVPNRSGDGFFHSHDQPLAFPFHPGISLASFCEKWDIECGDDPPDVNLVFIGSAGSGALETAENGVIWSVHGLSAIISFRIHVVPGFGLNSLDWWTILRRSGLSDFLTCRAVPYSAAIVLRGMGSARTAADSEQSPAAQEANLTDPEEMRRAQDANLTESFSRKCRRRWNSRDMVAIFRQPDVDRSTIAYRESMRDIAKAIVRRALTTRPLPPDDALGVLGIAAEMGWDRSWGVPTDFPLQSLLGDWAKIRLTRLGMSLTEKYKDAARNRSLQYYPGREIDPKAEAKDFAARASDEFRREFQAWPAQLRPWISEAQLEMEIRRFRAILMEELPSLVVNPRWIHRGCLQMTREGRYVKRP
jgi:hypothetical protein